MHGHYSSEYWWKRVIYIHAYILGGMVRYIYKQTTREQIVRYEKIGWNSPEFLNIIYILYYTVRQIGEY